MIPLHLNTLHFLFGIFFFIFISFSSLPSSLTLQNYVAHGFHINTIKRHHHPVGLPSFDYCHLKSRKTCIPFLTLPITLFSQIHDISDTKSDNDRIAKSQAPSPWCEAVIDYSAANEYMNAHYYNTTTHNKQPYFHFESLSTRSRSTSHSNSMNGDKDKKMESIYNARKGIYHHDTQTLQKPSLSSCGFTLQHFPSNVTNWKNATQISSIYVNEIRQHLIPRLFPSSSSVTTQTEYSDTHESNADNVTNNIRNIIFWFPMLREENETKVQICSSKENSSNSFDITTSSLLDPITPTTSIAPMAHIDTDVGAYEYLSSMFHLITNNRVHEQQPFMDPNVVENEEDILQAIENGHRFMIINIWRNISPNPIVSAPLAILSTHYNDKSKKSISTHEPKSNDTFFFPLAKPNMNQSWWYTFPYMMDEECLIFKQYDRYISLTSSNERMEQKHKYVLKSTSDLWHCAIHPENIPKNDWNEYCHDNSKDNDKPSSSSSSPSSSPSSSSSSSPRSSFDIRLLVVFDEILSPECDRFLLSRKKNMRPLLTHAESECFCDEQEQKRE